MSGTPAAGLPGRDDEGGDLWESEDLEDLDTDDTTGTIGGAGADGALDSADTVPPAGRGPADPVLGVPAAADDADELDDEDDEDADDDEDDADEVDFALLAWRTEGEWRVTPAPEGEATTWAGFKAAVRVNAGADAALGFAGLDGSYLAIVRVAGAGQRILLSDVEAADELDFAADLLDELRATDHGLDELIESGELDDAEDPVPVGDATLLEDLGLSADELRELCTDVDSDPEEMVEEIGDSLGIAALVVRALDALDV